MKQGTNRHDVCIAAIWACSIGIPMFLLASNLRDLSEVKVAAVGTLLGGFVHGVFKTFVK